MVKAPGLRPWYAGCERPFPEAVDSADRIFLPRIPVLALLFPNRLAGSWIVLRGAFDLLSFRSLPMGAHPFLALSSHFLLYRFFLGASLLL